jgi:hypothetical protein
MRFNPSIFSTALKLSVSPSAKATGSVSAHLIPSLNLGISALGGVADATVFLELDASAKMQLTLQAQASAATTVNGLTRSRARAAVPRSIGSDVLVTEVLAARDAKLGSLSLLSERELDARQAGASFGGCFSINAGLGVNAGANAEFFGLFDTGTKVPLFNREFELLKVSLPSPASRSHATTDANT